MNLQRALGYLFLATAGSLASAGCSAEAPASEDGVAEGEIRTSPAVSGLSACPRTFDEANAAACKPDLTCLYSLECGATPQQTRCECSNGKMVCTDRVGTVPAGDKQLCAPGSSADTSDCPVSRNAAEGASCRAAGRLCSYRGKVCHTTPGVALLDWCRCSPDGNGAYKFNCGSALCPPEP